MEEFLENIKLLVHSLGFKIFEELRKIQTTEEQFSRTFYINSARGANAKDQITNEGFVVLKDSEIAISLTNSEKRQWFNGVEIKGRSYLKSSRS